jgi:hypothetical protein
MIDLAKLRERVPIHEIEWRIGSASKDTSGKKPWAKILCYIDARTLMDRLDAVVGPENWQDQYIQTAKGYLCSIGIKIADEWVWKQDAADSTDIEATKGGISDSFKRTGVKWGVGRFLYDTGTTWAEISSAQSKACPEFKPGDPSFYWGPPRQAYVLMGYSDEEINSLDYYGGKPIITTHGQAAPIASPSPAAPAVSPSGGTATNDGGEAPIITPEDIMAKIATIDNQPHLKNYWNKHRPEAVSGGWVKEFDAAVMARKKVLTAEWEAVLKDSDPPTPEVEHE